MILLGMVKTEKTLESFLASNTVEQLKQLIIDCEKIRKVNECMKYQSFRDLLDARYIQIKLELASR